ncbi:DNA-dependent ATPase fun30 [Sporothrix curviconia]|uniref:DNA-dependent ATPase fun30 n=1 Tax=Sporothrix curviconia TaxID=1260050 RepID=A0ABP0BKT2_9PEZI
MDSSPLPTRSRSSGPFDSRRNPFTIAKEASLVRSNSSLSSKSSSSSITAKPQHTTQRTQRIQRTQQTQRTQKTQRVQPRGRLRRGDDSDDDADEDFNIDEEEDDIEDSDRDEEEEDEEEEEEEEEDELAGVGGFKNSPYFTQPTQAMTQLVTQPTQLLKKPPTVLRSGLNSLDNVPINIPSSSPPRSIIEVPASSPFQLSPKPKAAPPAPAPASSIIARGRIASLMAPAGTEFRPPADQVPPKLSKPASRAARSFYDDDDDNVLDKIISIDDSSDDDNDRRRRGDIRPSFFRSPEKGLGKPVGTAMALELEGDKQSGQGEEGEEGEEEEEEGEEEEGSPAKAGNKPSARRMLNDRKVQTLVAKMQRLLRNKGYLDAPPDVCKTALLECKYNIEEAVNDIFDARLVEEQATCQKKAAAVVGPSPIAKSKVPEMIRSFSYQANGSSKTTATNTTTTSRASTPATPSSQTSLKRSALSPDPRPKRRRLVQGRKYRDDPSSSQVNSPALHKEEESLVDLDDRSVDDNEDEDVGTPIEISDDEPMDDNDEDDAVIELDDDDEIDDASGVEKRVLEYFNTCTVDDLVAMLGAKARSKAETILSQRPFRSRASVTRIQSDPTTGGGRKKKSANIGEDIFDAVEEYVIALRAIDVVVTQCEQKGLQIRSTLHKWNVDFRGSNKLAPAADGAGADGLLTPASDSGTGLITSSNGKSTGYEPLPIPQEPALMRGHCTMKGYQLYGMNWLWELYQRNFGCILADDMGLGKTCQVISFLSHLVESYDGDIYDEDARPWPNLVIVPPSTLANWKTEFKKFAPKVRVTSYHGSMTERDNIFNRVQEHREKHHVVLASYSQVVAKQDVDAMRKIAPNVAIFDEGHKMKNANTNIYKSLRRIPADWRLILTGTPVQNNLMEMINLLNFIQPTLFERHLEKLDALFSQRFTLQDVSNGALLFSDRVRRARQILEPFILQRRKEQVLSSMPKKTTRVVSCALDATQRPIYEAYERQFREGRERRAAGVKSAPATSVRSTAVTGLSNDQNNVWVQLRKSAIHAQLFRRYYDDKKVQKMAEILMRDVPQAELRQPDLGHLVNELRDCSDFELHTWCRDYRCLRSFDIPDGLFLQSGKVHELLALVRQFQQNGDRALVFTRFARVLNILRECLTHEGIEYVSLEGATRVDERQDIIDQFNTNADIPVFLLTTGSGGTGINLTAANKVVIFDQSDNPQDDVQAENRAHRLGQTRDVEVIKLVTQGTIEELVYKACQTKLELAQRVTAGSASRAEELEVAEWGDGDRVAKAVEEQVRQMLLAKTGGEGDGKGEGATATPPKSEDGDQEAEDEKKTPRRRARR